MIVGRWQKRPTLVSPHTERLCFSLWFCFVVSAGVGSVGQVLSRHSRSHVFVDVEPLTSPLSTFLPLLFLSWVPDVKKCVTLSSVNVNSTHRTILKFAYLEANVQSYGKCYCAPSLPPSITSSYLWTSGRIWFTRLSLKQVVVEHTGEEMLPKDGTAFLLFTFLKTISSSRVLSSFVCFVLLFCSVCWYCFTVEASRYIPHQFHPPTPKRFLD